MTPGHGLMLARLHMDAIAAEVAQGRRRPPIPDPPGLRAAIARRLRRIADRLEPSTGC